MTFTIGYSPIRPNVVDIDTWSPQYAAPEGEFDYIDIASVDRDTKSITGTSRISTSEAPSRARQIVKANDVIVSTVRPNLNAVALVPEHLTSAIASTGFCVLRCHPKKLDYRYLFHWVRTEQFVADMVQQATGASYPAISDRIIKESRIPLPPLPEQKRIADILDKADAIRRKRREVTTGLGDYPLALFMEMFGHPDSNPKNWPMLKFLEVCDSRLGKMLDAKQQTGRHNRPYMRNLNVQWGRLDLSQVFEMDFDSSDRNEFRLQHGDVLICEGGAGVGQTAIWRDELPECYFQKSLHRVRPYPEKATSEYMAFLMWTLMKGSSLLRSISSATIPHLTGEKLKDVQIPVPPLKLQQHFSDQCRRVGTVTDNAASSRTVVDDLFNSLVQRAFRGEL